MRRWVLLFTVTLLLAACARTNSYTSEQSAGPLRLSQTIPLSNVEGRIDHLDVDAKGQRLFVAALGNNTVEVIDLQKGERTQTLRGFHEPQGIRYLPASNTLVVANGGDGIIAFWDASSFKQIKAVRFGGDADNVRYDPASHRVYVGYGEGALAVLDEKGERLGDIPLGGHPESFQLDTAGGRAYVNVPARQEIVVVDLNKMNVWAHWPVQSASANYPMSLDGEHHRLFVVTRKPAHLLVFDTEAGKLVATLKAGGDCDDVFYDAARRRIYASFGEGTLMAYEQQDPDHYQVIATVPTAAGARTSFFSPELRRLYVAVPHRGNSTAEVRVYQIDS
jgi:DNA-binding beta-propeller fold protein YncE